MANIASETLVFMFSVVKLNGLLHPLPLKDEEGGKNSQNQNDEEKNFFSH